MTKKRASGLKIDHYKLSSLSNREEKKKWEAKNWTGPQAHKRQYQKFIFVLSDSQKAQKERVWYKKNI